MNLNYTCFHFCIAILMGGPKIDVMVEEEEKMPEEMVATTEDEGIEAAEVEEAVEMQPTEAEAVRIGSR